ncbi:DUF1212-domain-containing protein [Penicillium soppii]|uniref:DUF1212-domain-containing protein n=1 Tax=Penicillium soppii TaxID=69789 RepID=UPI0025477FBE|nr:DUF1212-domain-containing protein [Penicillium soppii]KAJ5861455.1 DUF1212-domain-containing protein [Penicillium soppii]
MSRSLVHFLSLNVEENNDARACFNDLIREEDGDASANQKTAVSPQDSGNPHWEHPSTSTQASIAPSASGLSLQGTIIGASQSYITKVCRALMMYGAPTHRL